MKVKFETMIESVIDMFSAASPEEQQHFRAMEEPELIELHHSLGRTIRNHFSLWEDEWEPQIVDGIDMSDNHPDAVSMSVISEAWRRVQ